MVVEVALKFCGGGNIVEVKPIFSIDAKYVIFANGDEVRVCSVVSGQCIHRLRGHEKKVTGILLNPDNQFQLYSFSADGQCIKWDFTDGVLLHKFDVGHPLASLHACPGEDLAFYGVRQKPDGQGELVKVQLPDKQKQDESRCRVDTLLSPVDSSPSRMSVGCKGRLVAIVSDKELTIYQTNKQTSHSFPSERDNSFTCVACHPLENCVALGTTSGKIVLWWNVHNVDRHVKTVLHWHALPVLHLAFTSEGAHLISGGHECVLVKWQVGSSQRDLLPRLGAPITGISVSNDNTTYALCHSTNAIQLVNSQLRLLQSVQGLTRGLWQSGPGSRSPAVRHMHTGLVYEPRTRALVLNGAPGHVQFYDLHKDEQLFTLDVVGENYISPENVQRPLVYTEVERLAFSSTGDWMASVERRDDGDTAPESRLRLWAYDATSQRFTLNTSAELPHGTKRVNGLLFRPHMQAVVTTGLDGRYRYWALEDTSNIYGKKQSWVCASLGYYHDSEPTAADFSEDGSLLAVTFASTLTVWDPDTATLLHTVTLCRPPVNLRHVVFGRHAANQAVVCASRDTIVAWNALTTLVSWTKSLPVKSVVRDNCSDIMAVFTKNGGLLIMTPQSETPLYELTKTLDCPVVSAIFLTRPSPKQDALPWLRLSQLYFINERQEMLTLTTRDDEEPAVDGEPGSRLVTAIPTNPLTQLLSNKIKALSIPAGEMGDLDAKRRHEQLLDEILATPSHVLPHMSTFCMQLIETLLPPANAGSSPGHRRDKSMEIDSSDDEEGGKEKGDTDDSDSDAETGDKSTTERRYQYTRLEDTTPAVSTVTSTPGGKRPTLTEMVSGSVKPTIGELVRADPEVPENFFDWLKP